MVLLKVFRPLKACQKTFHGPTLNDASFSSISAVVTTATLQRLMLRNEYLDIDITYNGMTSLQNFTKFCWLVANLVWGTYRRTVRQKRIILKASPFFKKKLAKKIYTLNKIMEFWTE